MHQSAARAGPERTAKPPEWVEAPTPWVGKIRWPQMGKSSGPLTQPTQGCHQALPRLAVFIAEGLDQANVAVTAGRRDLQEHRPSVAQKAAWRTTSCSHIGTTKKSGNRLSNARKWLIYMASAGRFSPKVAIWCRTRGVRLTGELGINRSFSWKHLDRWAKIAKIREGQIVVSNDLRSGKDRSLQRRVRIRNYRYGEPVLESTAHRGVHAKLSLHTANQNVIYTNALQVLL